MSPPDTGGKHIRPLKTKLQRALEKKKRTPAMISPLGLRLQKARAKKNTGPAGIRVIPYVTEKGTLVGVQFLPKDSLTGGSLLGGFLQLSGGRPSRLGITLNVSEPSRAAALSHISSIINGALKVSPDTLRGAKTEKAGSWGVVIRWIAKNIVLPVVINLVTNEISKDKPPAVETEKPRPAPEPPPDPNPEPDPVEPDAGTPEPPPDNENIGPAPDPDPPWCETPNPDNDGPVNPSPDQIVRITFLLKRRVNPAVDPSPDATAKGSLVVGKIVIRPGPAIDYGEDHQGNGRFPIVVSIPDINDGHTDPVPN